LRVLRKDRELLDACDASRMTKVDSLALGANAPFAATCADVELERLAETGDLEAVRLDTALADVDALGGRGELVRRFTPLFRWAGVARDVPAGDSRVRSEGNRDATFRLRVAERRLLLRLERHLLSLELHIEPRVGERSAKDAVGVDPFGRERLDRQPIARGMDLCLDRLVAEVDLPLN